MGNAENSFLASESLSVTKRLQYFIVEKEKTARAFLKQIGHPKPQNELIFFELNKHQVELWILLHCLLRFQMRPQT